MKNMVRNRWVSSALWLIGLFVFWTVEQELSGVVTGLQNIFIKDDIVLPFVFGVYLSLLFIRSHKVLKLPVLLVVWLPLTLLWSYQLVSIYYTQFALYLQHGYWTEPALSPMHSFPHIQPPDWVHVFPINSDDLGAACGFSLATAWFAKSAKRNP